MTNIEPEREVSMTLLMTPQMANFSGNVHGGAILKLLDEVAYACGTRYAGTYVVTLSVDQVLFKQPIHVGELVTFKAMVNYVGRTSMEIGIRVEAENIQKRTVRHTNSSYFTMIAMGENGRPTKVPQLSIETDAHRKRYDAAVVRKNTRIEMSKSIQHIE